MNRVEACVNFKNGIVWKTVQKHWLGYILLRWIATYPVDKGICSFKNGIVWKTLQKHWLEYILLRWIATYPVDKGIRSFNNWGQLRLKNIPSHLFQINEHFTV